MQTMGKETVMSLENMVRDQIMTAASEKINFIYNRLNEPSSLTKLPLQVFDQYFAPYFFGQKALERDSDMFSTWVGIAGSPMAPVEIVDNNKVVFVVPPLYDTEAINLMKNTNMTRVMDEYGAHRNSLPAVAMKYVENTLLPQVDKVTQESKGNIEKWGVVANHYKPAEAKAVPTAKGTMVNNSDNDLSYDV